LRKSSSRQQGMPTSGVRKLKVNHEKTPQLAGGGWCKWIFCGLCMWCCYETCFDGSSDENKGE
ncbi:hypothetical protein H4R22_004223, partial [Coemansia sp. RSA 1290]